MENNTAEEKDFELFQSLQQKNGFNKSFLCAKEYASIKLAEKDKEIEGFAIGFSEWFILNGIEKARIDGHYWVRGNIYLNKTELIELYKQSLNN